MAMDRAVSARVFLLAFALVLVIVLAPVPTRVDAASATVCVYSDAECLAETACADIKDNECNALVEGSNRATFTCETVDGTQVVRNLQISTWSFNDNCPDDISPSEVLDVDVDFEENRCYDSNGATIKLTNIDCGGDCFPASAQVQLEDGSRKSMDQIEIGDRVKVSAKDDYSPVVFWGHKAENAVGTNFVRVTFVDDDRVLKLTGNHLAYVNNALIPAHRIRAGMTMMDAESGRELVVKSVEFTMRGKGLYNPHTAHGDLVVDGIVVSSYVFVAPGLAHALLVVERVMRALGLSALGSMLETTTPWLLKRALSAMP